MNAQNNIQEVLLYFENQGVLERSSISQAVIAASSAIISQQNLQTAINSTILADLAHLFHHTLGVITPRVLSNIEKLSAGAPIILFAHQPIAFPSEVIAGAHLFMDQLALHIETTKSFNVVPVHLVMDTDDSSEKLFRSARYPSPSLREGHFTLRATSRRLKSDQLMCSASATSVEWIKLMSDQLWRVIIQDVAKCKSIDPRLRKQIDRQFGLFQDSLTAAFSNKIFPRGLADQNANFLAFYSNLVWDTAVLHIRYSDLLEYVDTLKLIDEWLELKVIRADSISILNQIAPLNWSTREDSGSSEPFWTICDKCGSRYMPGNDLYETHSTERCYNITRKYGVGWKPSFKYLPRVALEDHLLATQLPILLEVSYAGGAEHKLVSYLSVLRMGNTYPLIMWRPEVKLGGYAKKVSKLYPNSINDKLLQLLQNKRTSLVYSQIAFSTNAYLEKWLHWFEIENCEIAVSLE